MNSEEKEEEQEKAVNTDEIIEHYVQPVGIWQIMVAIFAGFNAAPTTTLGNFILGASVHRCRLDEEKENYLKKFTFKEACLSTGPSQYDPASARNYTEHMLGCYMYIDFNNTESGTEKCSNGYVHEMPSIYYPDSLVPKWDLVCDSEWKIPFATLIYMLGMMCGPLFSGQVAGSIGRRRSIILFSSLLILSSHLVSLTPNYTLFLCLRYACALSLTGSMSNFFVLTSELTLSQNRSLYTSIIFVIAACINRLTIAIYAYFIPKWPLFNTVSMSCGLIGLLFPFLLPESPRWLVSQKRPKEAIFQLYNGYRMNKLTLFFHRKLDEKSMEAESFFRDKLDDMQCIKELKITRFMRKPYLDKPDIHLSIFQDFKRNNFFITIKKSFSSKELALKSIQCIALFSFQIVTFFGLLFYIRIMKGSIYFITSMNALSSLPSAMLTFLAYRYCKSRKTPLMVIYGLTSVILLSTGIYITVAKPEGDVLLIIGANMAYLCLTSTQSMLLIYVPELFPSDVRAQGLGNASGLGRMAGLVCDYINHLDTIVVHGLPLILYGGILILQTLMLIAMKDTNGNNLKDFS